MEDTLHYTLSTIPQVLAAIIALLGVFWVYKIDHLNKRLKTQAEVLKREIDYRSDPRKRNSFNQMTLNLKEKFGYSPLDTDRLVYRIDSTIQQEDYMWLYKTICDIYNAKENPIIKRVKKEYEEIDAEKYELTKNSKYVIVLSGVQIILSLILLTLVPVIIFISCLPYFIMIPNVIFFAIIIYLTVKTILKTLNITRINKKKHK